MGLSRSIRRLLALGFCFLPTGMVLAQETMYVTDIVQLGVHRAEDTSDTAFRNLVSGTEVTVLERVPNYARIRTPDGEEGWVRSFYLIDEEPARTQVAGLEARIETLELELAAAVVASRSAAAEVGDIGDEAALELAAAETDRERLARLELENLAFEERFESYRGSLPWLWVVGAVLVALGAGFFAGYSWLDAAIRRRYGGFKVY
jgi:SH3 domain protein